MKFTDWYRRRKREKRKERIVEMTEACSNALENGFQYYSKYLALHICFLMLKNHISREQLAETLGYSDYDMDRMLSGVLILAPCDIKDIANVLGVTREELMRKSLEDYYDTRDFTE